MSLGRRVNELNRVSSELCAAEHKAVERKT